MSGGCSKFLIWLPVFCDKFSHYSDNAVDYCIPLNPWQKTGNTGVQSKVKLQEVGHRKMIEKECLAELV